MPHTPKHAQKRPDSSLCHSTFKRCEGGPRVLQKCNLNPSVPAALGQFPEGCPVDVESYSIGNINFPAKNAGFIPPSFKPMLWGRAIAGDEGGGGQRGAPVDAALANTVHNEDVYDLRGHGQDHGGHCQPAKLGAGALAGLSEELTDQLCANPTNGPWCSRTTSGGLPQCRWIPATVGS